MLISDYSSVTFDFAYLKKPVIYTQFDKEEFYKSHIYDEGYFNDKRDGFGPVCNKYEDTVTTIIDMLKNDCKLDKKYESRIKKFFKYDDHNNCKRVYEAIKNIDK